MSSANISLEQLYHYQIRCHCWTWWSSTNQLCFEESLQTPAVSIPSWLLSTTNAASEAHLSLPDRSTQPLPTNLPTTLHLPVPYITALPRKPNFRVPFTVSAPTDNRAIQSQLSPAIFWLRLPEHTVNLSLKPRDIPVIPTH